MNGFLAEGIHSFPFPVMYKLLKFIKIFESYDHKCTETFFYETQCTINPLWPERRSRGVDVAERTLIFPTGRGLSAAMLRRRPRPGLFEAKAA